MNPKDAALEHQLHALAQAMGPEYAAHLKAGIGKLKTFERLTHEGFLIDGEPTRAELLGAMGRTMRYYEVMHERPDAPALCWSCFRPLRD